MKRMRALLIAEACNPSWTSTPLQAYYWFKHLSELADVTLVTQVRNRDGWLAADEANVGKITFIDTERVARPLQKLATRIIGSKTGMGIAAVAAIPGYYLFERLLWEYYGSELRSRHYDIVHRLTPSSPIVPSWLACRCPVPFVIGPLIGSLPWPKEAGQLRKAEGERLSTLRSTVRLLPCWRSTFTHAKAVLLASTCAGRLLPNAVRRRACMMPWNGVDTRTFRPDPQRRSTGRLRVLFVGRLVPLKQPGLIVDAVAQCGVGTAEVTFVGEGPAREEIARRAAATGMAKYIRVVGGVDHSDLPVFYNSADLLVLPSMHESGGAVLLEAMACGLPCAVIDYGGPADLVKEDVGFRVQLGSYSDMVAGFGRVISRALREPECLGPRSRACRVYIEQEHDWRSKARQMVRLYSQIAGG